MSAPMPVKRGNGSWPPFEKGNQAARRSGLRVKVFSVAESEEIEAIVDGLREALPLSSPSFEPTLALLGMRVWRLERGYRWLEEQGEGNLSDSFVRYLGALENRVSKDFADLGLSPRAASELGLNLARLASVSEPGESYDFNALEPKEQRQFERMLAKMRGGS